MAKVRVISNPFRVGRVGADTFYIVKGVQVVRPSRNVTNYGETARRSEAQQERRVKWANLVAIYKTSKFFMSRAFETKTQNQSDYNKFMSVNMGTSLVSLTKDEAEQGACVIEPLVMSMGSLPSLNVYNTTPGLLLGLYVQVPTLEGETVATLTSDLLVNNPQLREGMQLSYIVWEQVQEDGIPRVYMNAYEMTLSTLDESTVASHFPGITLSVDDGQLMIVHPTGKNGAVMAMLSYSADGKGIRTSTQTAQLFGSRDLYNEYTSSQAEARARESYGEDEQHFLDSGDLND